MRPGEFLRSISRRAFALAWALLATPVLAQLPIDTSRTLAAGHDHNVAVITSVPNAGQVWAWGGNASGKLGNGSTINASIPVQVGKNLPGFTNIKAVAASQGNSYAIAGDGTLWAWGDHSDQMSPGSRLGIGPTAPDICVWNGSNKPCAKSPVKVRVPGTPGHPTPGIQKIVQVGAGWGHVIALREDGTVWAWGKEEYGAELGQNGSSLTLNLPTQVKGPNGVGFLTGIVEIAVGYFHTVARKSDGTLVAWGRNDAGQLGHGTFNDNSPAPFAIPSFSNVTAIRAKGAFTLALNNVGTLYAWGDNHYGQLGVGPAAGPVGGDLAVPTQILTNVAAMEAGYSTAFAKLTNGNIMAWGLDAQADPQLGIPPGIPANNCNGRPCVRMPTQVAAYSGASAIVAGGAHTIVVRADQSLALFGNNASGQLGDNRLAVGGGTFGTTFSQSSWDPSFTMTPLPVGGTGSSVGARSRVGGLSLLALGAGIDFGTRTVNTGAGNAQTITFENLDTVAVSIDAITPPADYTTSGGNCANNTVGSGGACTFDVEFAPSATGPRTGTLAIPTSSANEPNATIDVVVTGVGIAVPGAPTGANATAGNAQATITFSPPASDGGAAISSHTVTSSPGGLNASGAGSPLTVTGLANGTAYTFTVTATNSVGTGPASAPSNSVTPQAPTVTLTVAKNGTGLGTVTSAPAGINCGATCAAPFTPGTGVTLTAVPSSGSTFGGWAGGGCSGTGGCTVTLNAAATVTATFTAAAGTFALSVSKTGSGSGTVTSSPAGIDCGPTCAGTFTSGASVTLSAAAASGSSFTGWSGGGCSGTGTCMVTLNSAVAVSATFTAAVTTRVFGISTRMQVLTGDNVLIGGFIISGGSAKTVVVRARGPSLGVAGALADPTLTLVPASGPASSNDDWGTAGNAAALSASGFAPSNAKESALMMTLGPGAYTAIVSGVGNTTGIAIVEVYEIDQPTSPMTGISTRGRVQTGDNVMIGGFIIQGDSPQTVVVRARGPSMTSQGVAGALQNPILQLVFASDGTVLTNDDWGTAANASTLQSIGFAPADTRESAILITLNPGAYTAIVSGVGGTIGVAIVEVYVP